MFPARGGARKDFVAQINLCVCSAAHAVLPGEQEDELVCHKRPSSPLSLVWQRVTYARGISGKCQMGNLTQQGSALADG